MGSNCTRRVGSFDILSTFVDYDEISATMCFFGTIYYSRGWSIKTGGDALLIMVVRKYQDGIVDEGMGSNCICRVGSFDIIITFVDYDEVLATMCFFGTIYYSRGWSIKTGGDALLIMVLRK